MICTERPFTEGDRKPEASGQTELGTVPLKTDKRGLGDVNVTVKFGGVEFIPGQFVYADNNGVIVSPQKLEIPE